MIFAGVFDGGCGGEVGRVLPGQSCYACMAAYLQRRDSAHVGEEPPQGFDYTSPDASQRSTAALNIDIAQIALIQARVALLTLLRDVDASGDLEGNYVLFANRAVPGLFDRMLASEIWSIPRDPSCLVCGGSDNAEVAQSAHLLLAAAEARG